MKGLKILSISLLLTLTVVLSGCTLPFMKKKKAALQVFSNPQTTVFLDDNHVGKTPYFDETLKEGEYTLKLVPDSEGSDSLLTWQGIVKLYPGIMTVVSRNLAESEEKTSGYTLTLEPITDKEKARISVISTPDGVVVNLDGEPKGFTPISIDDVMEGERVLTISAPGFKEETIKAKAVKGYKLMIDVQLAKDGEEEKEEEDKEATDSAELDEDEEDVEIEKDKEASPGAAMERPYVEIKETPTDWLKVRSEPSTAEGDDTVITKIYPGEVYKFIEANDAGWYKIEYKKGEQGWISGKYAELYK
ncbi:PEGA domain-containing protein [Patescibacteria group bacterium]